MGLGKITRERNNEIYRRVKKGEKIESVAASYGLSVKVVREMVRYRDYKAVDVNSPKYLKAYIKEKIKILKDLGIAVTDEHKKHMESLKTDLEIDQYAHKLIME